jgi:hypothetical protein
VPERELFRHTGVVVRWASWMMFTGSPPETVRTVGQGLRPVLTHLQSPLAIYLLAPAPLPRAYSAAGVVAGAA